MGHHGLRTAVSANHALHTSPDAGIAHDEPVWVEGDVADELPRAEPDDAVSKRFVPLLRHADPERRNLDPAHQIFAARSGMEKVVSNHGQRVEQRRPAKVKEVRPIKPKLAATHTNQLKIESPRIEAIP